MNREAKRPKSSMVFVRHKQDDIANSRNQMLNSLPLSALTRTDAIELFAWSVQGLRAFFLPAMFALFALFAGLSRQATTNVPISQASGPRACQDALRQQIDLAGPAVVPCFPQVTVTPFYLAAFPPG